MAWRSAWPPAIGPMIGGYVFVHAGWPAQFWLLGAMALVALWAAAAIVPTPPAAAPPMAARTMIANYVKLMTVPAYLRFLIPQAAIFGALFAFITSGPFLLIDAMHVRTEDYGLYYGAIVLAFIGGSFLANRLASAVSPGRLFVLGICGAVLGAAIFAIPILRGVESLVSVMAGMMLFAVGLGLIFATGPLLLLNQVTDWPQGPASAMLGFSQLFAASLGALMVGELHDGSALPVALAMALFVGVGTLAYGLLSVRAMRPV